MKIDVSSVKTTGRGLVRPEGVMALDDGRIYTADGRGRCTRIEKDGHTGFWGNLGGVPNGICIDEKGNCIVANIGNGQVQSLAPDGTHIVLMTHAEGKRMSSPNFPFVDSGGRLWVSNSTALPDIESALQSPVADGCLVVIINGEAKIVAEGICFANGVSVDEKEEFVYVAETMKKRILRYRINNDANLGEPEIYGPDSLGPFGFPDGIAFDEAGNLWVALPAQNAIGYINPAREFEIYLEDPEQKVLRRPANICFGGEKRKTAFIGSLDGTNVPYFAVPYPGARLIHQKI
ncbi:MAG TPA: SMP-30/gluconolactonase/LRE family protein [Smithellaceae bacterium]|nr:SMP-30/gluconolactonase/LRE family protein [Smithellaceae bacterium]HRS88203.1 SMP-30/gluconolactonase/LRE family protein [Smithellaceae bacterium]HRV25689.1 SMP-30/gluconolactonase/LRE family protein [Smithellaceae bacterium]